MSNEWEQPASPPPPLFLGEKEKNLVKQINDEIIERVVGQQVLYFPIDIEHTNYHPIYGEAVEKNFLHPVRVFALVEYDGIETSDMDGFAIDKSTKLILQLATLVSQGHNLAIGIFVQLTDGVDDVEAASIIVEKLWQIAVWRQVSFIEFLAIVVVDQVAIIVDTVTS